MNSVSLFSCTGVFIILSVLGRGDSLECFKCNATFPQLNLDNPCNGTGSLQECQDPAICLSATYSFNDASSPTKKQYTTFKTCYPIMDGQECNYFLKAIQGANPEKGNIEWSDICYTCQEKGCNKFSKTAKPDVENPELLVITL